MKKNICPLKTKTLPAVAGALGLIPKGIQEQINKISAALSLHGIIKNISNILSP